MTATADKTDPKLWDEVKKKVTEGDKGGKPGQWSARKAQMATQQYKKEGGGYAGEKTADNHLTEWTREEWGTKSGEQSGKTGERYLPRQARAALSDREYERTTKKKQADTRRGKQFSAQPHDVAAKVAHARAADAATTRAELAAAAARLGVKGRSKMTKAQLQRAVAAAS